jgi:hypothetical protein
MAVRSNVRGSVTVYRTTVRNNRLNCADAFPYRSKPYTGNDVNESWFWKAHVSQWFYLSNHQGGRMMEAAIFSCDSDLRETIPFTGAH